MKKLALMAVDSLWTNRVNGALSPRMSRNLLVAYDENVTPGWTALALASVLRIPERQSVDLVMQLHSQGWVDLSGKVPDVEKAGLALAGLGLDVRLSEGDVDVSALR